LANHSSVLSNIHTLPQTEVRIMVVNECLPEFMFVQPEFGRVERDGEVIKQGVVIRAQA